MDKKKRCIFVSTKTNNNLIYINMKNQKTLNTILETIAYGLIAFCVAGIVQLIIQLS